MLSRGRRCFRRSAGRRDPKLIPTQITQSGHSCRDKVNRTGIDQDIVKKVYSRLSHERPSSSQIQVARGLSILSSRQSTNFPTFMLLKVLTPYSREKMKLFEGGMCSNWRELLEEAEGEWEN